jgi:hypothetical protein
VTPALAAGARGAASLGLFSGAAAILLFDWSVRDLVVGAGIGALLWGSVWFLGIRHLVPRGTLLVAPADAIFHEERGDGPRLLARALWIVPLCAAGLWLADKWEWGLVFFPGQFFGVAAAYGLALILAVRWERVHGVRALFRDNDGETEVFATNPPATR